MLSSCKNCWLMTGIWSLCSDKLSTNIYVVGFLFFAFCFFPAFIICVHFFSLFELVGNEWWHQMEGIIGYIQRNLDDLGKWASRKLVKFNKDKCKLLHLDYPVHQCMLGNFQWQLDRKGRSHPGRHPIEPAVCPCHREGWVFWCILGKVLSAGGERLSFPSMQHWWGATVQKRHGHTRESPTKDHEDAEGHFHLRSILHSTKGYHYSQSILCVDAFS